MLRPSFRGKRGGEDVDPIGNLRPLVAEELRSDSRFSPIVQAGWNAIQNPLQPFHDECIVLRIDDDVAYRLLKNLFNSCSWSYEPKSFGAVFPLPPDLASACEQLHGGG